MSHVLAAALVLAATPLTLEEVRARARNQLDAVRAELDLSRAREDVRLARSGILPQLSVQASVSAVFVGPQNSFSTVPVIENGQPVVDANGNPVFALTVVETPAVVQGPFRLSLGIQQLLYDGGRWWNRIAQAGAREEAAEGQLEEQRLSSELEATRRFYELLNAQTSLQVLEASVVRSREQVDRARALYEAGRGQRSAVYDAQTNLTNDQINVVRQRQRIVQARLALLQWLGMSDAEVDAVAPAGLDSPSELGPVEGALETSRTRRALVRSLRSTVQAADLGIWVASGNYWPTLSLTGNATRSAPNPDFFFRDPIRQNSISGGVTLSWNIFDGLSTSAQVAQARIEHRRAVAQETQALLDLEAELRRAHDSVRTSLEVLRLARESLEVAEAQLKLEEERFSAGAGSSLEVRNAQLKFTQAQLQVLTGQADVAVSRASLERSAGGAL